VSESGPTTIPFASLFTGISTTRPATVRPCEPFACRPYQELTKVRSRRSETPEGEALTGIARPVILGPPLRNHCGHSPVAPHPAPSSASAKTLVVRIRARRKARVYGLLERFRGTLKNLVALG
jgi:hypothetical protein